jgi:glycosyltransferase involved in cell wall biosynthesis
MYVLITPARNEAPFLPSLIESVVAQTVVPKLWVVISDGSIDNTDNILAAAAQRYSFIRFLRLSGGTVRGFGAKARAFQAGLTVLGDTSYSFIGNLDADVSFGPRYYERLLIEMGANLRLGVISGVCWDKTATGFKCVTISTNHAVGATQFFRRRCFEEIDGYRPTSVGGVDSLATLTARMKGWQTHAFPDLPFYHHKPVDSAGGRSAIRISYRAGMTEYHIGSHPAFAVAKAIRRWRSRPLVFSVFVRLFGYFRLYLSSVKRDAPDDLVAYLRTEQLALLRRRIFLGRFLGNHTP